MNREASEEFTLEDFVVALAEVTAPLAHDKERAYKIIAFILSDLLHNSEPASKSWH
jgi:hypothetical protein